MTADTRYQKGREEKMGIKNEKALSNSPPFEHDEGWWDAVLADEPMIDMEVKVTPAMDSGEIDLLVDPDEQMEGQKKTSSSSVNWVKIRKLFTNDEIIKMNVVGYNRGGILVAVEDVHGFVPASHLIDIPSDISDDDREPYLMSYLDRQISLKVIECDSDNERIVFSERAAQAKEGQRKQILKTLKNGDVVCGKVTNVTSFGAFVDLGGLEGLIHVSELSWGRVSEPSEVIRVDDNVESMVLEVSEDKCRIALSLKRLKENPWISIAEKISPGDVVDATITSIVKYGAFACLPEGIEGLIHISSMNFPHGCKHIDEFLYEGQPVRVCVLNFDANKRRLGLELEEF
jgi:small subunit ribosomal protein S1